MSGSPRPIRATARWSIPAISPIPRGATSPPRSPASGWPAGWRGSPPSRRGSTPRPGPARAERRTVQEGIAPEDFAPTEDEQLLLIDLAEVIGRHGRPGAALSARLEARFDDETLVNLATYGATMLATNVFNNAIGVPLDDHLAPFAPALSAADA